MCFINDLDFYCYWINNPNHTYTMENRNKDIVECKVIYFPIKTNYDETKIYNPPRALIQIGNSDFREVPYIYINK